MTLPSCSLTGLRSTALLDSKVSTEGSEEMHSVDGYPRFYNWQILEAEVLVCAWPSGSLVAIPGNVEAGTNRENQSGEMGSQVCAMNLQSSELERGRRKGMKGTTE